MTWQHDESTLRRKLEHKLETAVDLEDLLPLLSELVDLEEVRDLVRRRLNSTHGSNALRSAFIRSGSLIEVMPADVVTHCLSFLDPSEMNARLMSVSRGMSQLICARPMIFRGYTANIEDMPIKRSHWVAQSDTPRENKLRINVVHSKSEATIFTVGGGKRMTKLSECLTPWYSFRKWRVRCKCDSWDSSKSWEHLAVGELPGSTDHPLATQLGWMFEGHPMDDPQRILKLTKEEWYRLPPAGVHSGCDWFNSYDCSDSGFVFGAGASSASDDSLIRDIVIDDTSDWIRSESEGHCFDWSLLFEVPWKHDSKPESGFTFSQYEPAAADQKEDEADLSGLIYSRWSTNEWDFSEVHDLDMVGPDLDFVNEDFEDSPDYQMLEYTIRELLFHASGDGSKAMVPDYCNSESLRKIEMIAQEMKSGLYFPPDWEQCREMPFEMDQESIKEEKEETDEETKVSDGWGNSREQESKSEWNWWGGVNGWSAATWGDGGEWGVSVDTQKAEDVAAVPRRIRSEIEEASYKEYIRMICSSWDYSTPGVKSSMNQIYQCRRLCRMSESEIESLQSMFVSMDLSEVLSGFVIGLVRSKRESIQMMGVTQEMDLFFEGIDKFEEWKQSNLRKRGWTKVLDCLNRASKSIRSLQFDQCPPKYRMKEWPNCLPNCIHISMEKVPNDDITSWLNNSVSLPRLIALDLAGIDANLAALNPGLSERIESLSTMVWSTSTVKAMRSPDTRPMFGHDLIASILRSCPHLRVLNLCDRPVVAKHSNDEDQDWGWGATNASYPGSPSMVRWTVPSSVDFLRVGVLPDCVTLDLSQCDSLICLQLVDEEFDESMIRQIQMHPDLTIDVLCFEQDDWFGPLGLNHVTRLHSARDMWGDSPSDKKFKDPRPTLDLSSRVKLLMDPGQQTLCDLTEYSTLISAAVSKSSFMPLSQVWKQWFGTGTIKSSRLIRKLLAIQHGSEESAAVVFDRFYRELCELDIPVWIHQLGMKPEGSGDWGDDGDAGWGETQSWDWGS